MEAASEPALRKFLEEAVGSVGCTGSVSLLDQRYLVVSDHYRVVIGHPLVASLELTLRELIGAGL